MASVLVIRPERRFRQSRFKGNYILRDLTRLRNSWFRSKTRLAYVRRRRLRLLGMSGVVWQTVEMARGPKADIRPRRFLSR
jgi:hypothetical protein